MLVGKLQKVHEKYPANDIEDLRVIRKVKEKFPQVSITAVLDKWENWMMDNPPKKNWNWRSRFHNFCANEIRFKQQRTEKRKGSIKPAVDRKINTSYNENW